MIQLIDERVRQPDCRSAAGAPRFLLDGFPRTLPQADALDGSGLGPELVLYLAVDDAVLVARLTGRRSCPGCGAPYHVLFQPPRREGVCDACGSALVHRSDDQEGPIRQRLAAYAAQTAPLVERYGARLRRIDGEQSPAAVLQGALAAVARASSTSLEAAAPTAWQRGERS
jgi:adenylate kinase